MSFYHDSSYISALDDFEVHVMSYVCKVIFQEILAQKNYAGSKSHIYTKNVKLFLSTK